MNSGEAIKNMLKYNHKTQGWLADKMGYAGANGINTIINSNSGTSTDILLDICDILDFEITLQPKRKAGARPQGQILIDEKKGKKETK